MPDAPQSPDFVSDKNISFYQKPVIEEILKRAEWDDRHLTARRDLMRYYQLVREAVPALSDDEAALLCDVFEGRTFGDDLQHVRLWPYMAETTDDVFEAHDVDREVFIERVRGWSFAEKVAVIDYLERECD